MRKQILIITVILCCTSNRPAFPLGVSSGCGTSNMCLSNCTIVAGSTSHCNAYTTSYYTGSGLSDDEYGGVISCQTCASGATRQQASITLATNCTATYYYCACSCSTSGWSSGNTGYEKRTVCNNSTCATSTEYRCAAGYWGTSTNGTSGCSPCPTWTGVYTSSAKTTSATGTSPTGTTAITGCYVVSGTYYDTTGTLTTSGNCAYKS
ncbi:MAG: hypothetical protein NC311_02395 [Muribaculaceae bacterium]|nr:hypothetical protein [Muribaculaceae bacterium]